VGCYRWRFQNRIGSSLNCQNDVIMATFSRVLSLDFDFALACDFLYLWPEPLWRGECDFLYLWPEPLWRGESWDYVSIV
jgi:hypothetical protein